MSKFLITVLILLFFPLGLIGFLGDVLLALLLSLLLMGALAGFFLFTRTACWRCDSKAWDHDQLWRFPGSGRRVVCAECHATLAGTAD